MSVPEIPEGYGRCPGCGSILDVEEGPEGQVFVSVNMPEIDAKLNAMGEELARAERGPEPETPAEAPPPTAGGAPPWPSPRSGFHVKQGR